jgi:putative hydrolase
MTNARLAGMFEEVADLLEQQGASPHRVRAWRDGARGIRDHHREMTEVFRDHGRVGLEAIPGIGHKLSGVIVEVIRSGRCAALDRLRGEAQHLEWLPPQAHALRATDEPPVELLLAIDREYREAADAGRLQRIAPRRFNPKHEAWLPIMHVDRDGWSFTALFSNTELAHHLHRTDDWVVIYFHRPHESEGQATVVTERRGWQRGQRVVRGRELECAAHWTDFDRRAS